MSQTLESSPVAAQDWPSSEPAAPAAPPRSVGEERPSVAETGFDYRPLPVLAVVAFALSVLSGIAFLGVFGIFLSAIALLLGGVSWLRIWRSAGTLGGKTLSIVGVLLAFVCLTGGTAVQVYAYQHEVPPEFRRVSFAREISAKDFVTVEGESRLHPDVEALLGQNVFLKGFMYPTGQVDDLPGFLLLKDTGECCFGGKPKLTDMIGVVMQEEQTVDFYAGRVSVGGVLRLNEKFTGADSLEPLYMLEGSYFSKSKTAF